MRESVLFFVLKGLEKEKSYFSVLFFSISRLISSHPTHFNAFVDGDDDDDDDDVVVNGPVAARARLGGAGCSLRATVATLPPVVSNVS